MVLATSSSTLSSHARTLQRKFSVPAQLFPGVAVGNCSLGPVVHRSGFRGAYMAVLGGRCLQLLFWPCRDRYDTAGTLRAGMFVFRPSRGQYATVYFSCMHCCVTPRCTLSRQVRCGGNFSVMTCFAFDPTTASTRRWFVVFVLARLVWEVFVGRLLV